MARLPRLVLLGIPHHVTQRGNRRERTFFEDGDYALYLDLLADGAQRAGVAIWSYCLMPNHVHIVAVPPVLRQAQECRRLNGAARSVCSSPLNRLHQRPSAGHRVPKARVAQSGREEPT